MATPRTFQVKSPRMTGDDVRAWQETLNRQMRTWQVDHRLKLDGDYGITTRDLTATVLYGLGVDQARMARGVTPELRTKLRNKRLTPAESARFVARAGWRKRLRARHAAGGQVAPPLATVLGDTWGYHPGVHDGMDLICKPNAPIYAMCDGEIVRADSSGWWGKGAPSDPALRGKGDGIIILRSTTDAGPFFKGLNLGYGHAEHPTVRAGQKVKAGDVIGRAGFANAWHVHLVANVGEGDRGIGDRDPRPFYDFAMGRR